MRNSIRVAPGNSLVLLTSATGGVVPESMGGKLIASTPTCIAIETLAEHDGETRISLRDEDALGDEAMLPAFDAVLSTPSRVIAVQSVTGETLVDAAVPATETRVRVWVNDSAEPDEIVIVFG